MIISKTPLRISFVGGGSDYKKYFEKSPGCVIGTTINQYVYVTIMPLPTFADEDFRFTYRITESVKKIEDIKHPVVRSVLMEQESLVPLNMATMANLPGRSGLGSSSSFTVGFLNAISAWGNKNPDALELASEAIRHERIVLKEDGGHQDQYHAAYGGFRSYRFEQDGNVVSKRVDEDGAFASLLSSCLFLVPVSGSRDSVIFAKETEKSISDPHKVKILDQMTGLAMRTSDFLLDMSNSPEEKMQKLLVAVNLGWEMKEEVSGSYPNKEHINVLINSFKEMGAKAARLCGAGGSGFVLLISEIGQREELSNRLSNYNAFNVEIERSGSQIVLRERDEYSSLGVVK